MGTYEYFQDSSNFLLTDIVSIDGDLDLMLSPGEYLFVFQDIFYNKYLLLQIKENTPLNITVDFNSDVSSSGISA